jgi:hypothetical protein
MDMHIALGKKNNDAGFFKGHVDVTLKIVDQFSFISSPVG